MSSHRKLIDRKIPPMTLKWKLIKWKLGGGGAEVIKLFGLYLRSMLWIFSVYTSVSMMNDRKFAFIFTHNCRKDHEQWMFPQSSGETTAASWESPAGCRETGAPLPWSSNEGMLSLTWTSGLLKLSLVARYYHGRSSPLFSPSSFQCVIRLQLTGFRLM